MKIKFDNTVIDSKYIMKLSQRAKLFDDTFKLGATLCIEVNLQVRKEGVQTQPTNVYLLDDSDTKIISLCVDNINTNNENYYDYTLTDSMIKFNQVYDWSALTNPTAQRILNAMCNAILRTNAPTIAYMSDLVITWSQNITARDFISYIAEVNGCYARINENNVLEFVANNRSVTNTIDINTCSEVKIGSGHIFDRVVVDLGSATAKYPADGSYVGTGETYYINPENIFITDSQGYTREQIVRRIYDAINGFTFYNIKIPRCQFSTSIQAGDVIQLRLENNSTIPFIAQFEWDYSKEWQGGFELDVENKQQGETKIITSAEKAVKNLEIVVNREIGSITQRVEDTEGSVTQLQQTATSIQADFVRKTDDAYVDLTTGITFSADGINITSSNIDTNLQLASNGVYIKDANNNNITTMQRNQFTMGEWVMQQSSNVLNMFKEH